ncbi:hypothetical protein RhiirC2_784405 [Rhizophagus irregularis]|uniref:Uncharacterized protein n=1 Tax=Rhizophagus irregularis TaxID=588596 RepID=A0A2N1MYP3_9GLOM|nr:hypothetical protein RhiirC2_784405 [Rhizophagus irregularis]
MIAKFRLLQLDFRLELSISPASFDLIIFDDDFVLEREVCEALGYEDDFVLEREVREALGDLKVLGDEEDDFVLKKDRKVSDDVLEPRIRKVPYFCSDCEGMLVTPRTKNRHELLSQLLSDVSEDNEPSEVLENTENINDESSQLTILNEQRVDRLPRRCRSRYISTRVFISNIGNIEQDLSLRESTAKDQSEDVNEDNKSNGDDELENNNSETFEDYSCPSFKSY